MQRSIYEVELFVKHFIFSHSTAIQFPVWPFFHFRMVRKIFLGLVIMSCTIVGEAQAFPGLNANNAGRKDGLGKTVLLDYWFNNEWKKDVNGHPVRWHYTWEDQANSGFSYLKKVFNDLGARTESMDYAPTTKSLKNAAVYIIVDPDTEKETEKPNYITDRHAAVISKWVKSGGVLLLFANDKGNADLEHTNNLSDKFGITFNEDNFNLVPNNQYEQGEVITGENPVFTPGLKLFIKELATLKINSPAKAVLMKNGKTIAAISSYGKGSVFVIGDPWLYNEYVDGKKLPAEYQNYQAAVELATWALHESKK